jgi:hypothetical protein
LGVVNTVTVLAHIFNIVGRYRDIATTVRVSIFYDDPEKESPIQKTNQKVFIRSLARLVNSFTKVTAIKIGAKTLGEIQWLQVRDCVAFYSLSLKGWELYLGVDVAGQEPSWKQICEGSNWDRRFLSWQRVLTKRMEERLAKVEEQEKQEATTKAVVASGSK